MSGDSKRKKKVTQSDDELLEACIKANQQCSHTTCNKSITLIKLQCNHCTRYFCTTHVLPEVHGCGGAARKAASAPTKNSTNQEKAHDLEKKLCKKLDKMKSERKKKGNPK